MYMYVFKHFSHLHVHTKMQEIYTDCNCCVCKFNFTSLSAFVTDRLTRQNWFSKVHYLEIQCFHILLWYFNENVITIIRKDKQLPFCTCIHTPQKNNIWCCARTILTHVHVYIFRKWHQYNMYRIAGNFQMVQIFVYFKCSLCIQK